MIATDRSRKSELLLPYTAERKPAWCKVFVHAVRKSSTVVVQVVVPTQCSMS